MSAPNKVRSPACALFLVTAMVATAGSVWLLLDDRVHPAGWAAAAAGACLVASSVVARGGLWTFLDAIAYRVFDAAVLGSIAWVTRGPQPALSVAALLALGAGFLASYVVARGRALGYSIWGSTTNRAIRCGLVVLVLLAPGAALWLWALVAFSTLTALVRGSQAFKEERA